MNTDDIRKHSNSSLIFIILVFYHLKLDLLKHFYRNWVLAKKFNFLTPISLETDVVALLIVFKYQKFTSSSRAGRVPGGTIVLSWERTERSKTTPSFRKKNERLERVLKNIGTFSKRTERNGTGIAWKERLKSLTRSYYQERVLSWERILNQECMVF